MPGALPGLIVCMLLVSPFTNREHLFCPQCHLFSRDLWGIASGAAVSTDWSLLGICLSVSSLPGCAKSWAAADRGPAYGRGREPRRVEHRGNNSQQLLGFRIQSCLLPVALCGFGFLTYKVGLIFHPLWHFVKTRDSIWSLMPGTF